ncbi:MAG: excisionase family DNA-binding protein [Actinobacteria bacterium]|nr:excisionase family DNA-binding protein [Actinomycetota bacterium]
MEDQTRSLSEVAGLMGVSERTVRRWIKAGRLKAYKPGRDYRIPETGLRAFIEESEISPKAQAPLSFNDVLEEERRALGIVRDQLAAYAHISKRLEAVAAARTFEADAFRKADEGLEEAMSELHRALRELRDQGVAIRPGTPIGDEAAAAERRLVAAHRASIEAAYGMLPVDEVALRRKQNAEMRAGRDNPTANAAP